MPKQVRYSSTLICLLCVLPVSGCGQKSTPATSPAQVLDTIPLPPGATSPRSWGAMGTAFKTAEYQDTPTAALMAFYQDYFAEHGWAPHFSEATTPGNMAGYRKESTSVTVVVTPPRGKLQLMLTASTLDVHQSDAPPELIARVTEKVPLPPLAQNVQVNRKVMDRGFNLKAYVPDTPPGDILNFYRDYLKASGWEDSFPPENPPEDMIAFNRDHESVTVVLDDLGTGLELGVLYHEFEYTRDEFGQLVRETADPDAISLSRKAVEAYGGLASYTDSGAYEHIHDGKVLSSAVFETNYVAPDRFLLDYTESLGGWHRTRHVLSKRGNSVQAMASYDEAPKTGTDFARAIAGLCGVTSGVSGNIPELLLREGNGALADLVECRLIEEAETDDGVACARLRGKDFGSREITIWIGKEDYLIRKIESVTDAKNHETTTYHPIANAKIAPETLKFRRPETD